MSKDCCRRLIKKIAGDSILIINHKVDKIFENYDADKDENLKL
jgi:carbamate kinase